MHRDPAMYDIFRAYNLYDQFIHADRQSYKTKLSFLDRQMYQPMVATIVTDVDDYFVGKRNNKVFGAIDFLNGGYALFDEETQKTIYFILKQILIINNGNILEEIESVWPHLNSSEEGKKLIKEQYKEFL